MRSFKTLALASASALALSFGPAMAETTLRLATIAPDGTPWGSQLARFAQAVEEESSGDLHIEVFYSGQLGSEQDTFAQVARGRIDFGFFSNTSVALQVPEAIFSSLYLYFQDQDERDCILDNHMVEPMREAFLPRGAYFMGFAEAGPNNLIGSVPAVDPREIEGMKLGIAISPVARAFWESYGLNVSALAETEGASSLQTGLIDFALAPPILYVAAGYGQIAPVYSNIGLQMNSAVLMLSEATRSGLTDEQFAALERAWARNPAAQLRDEIQGADAHMLGLHTQNGGTVVTPTDEQMAAWRAPMADFYARAVEMTGEGGARMFAALEEGRAACRQ